jgi:colanic acid biosynthesis glycosyl transferase WcaI
MSDKNKPAGTLLVLSQVYVPDPASVGQHMADAAAEMARRGWRVIVYTANRGYDDPSLKYSPREVVRGVEVRRLPFSSFGKRSLAHRVLGQLLFLLQCIARGGFARDLKGIFITTSPPMAAIAALAISLLRSRPVKYWVMDVNPDQAIALGHVKPDAAPTRALNWLNRLALKRSSDVVTLDRFMAERLLRKVDIRHKLTILPPWPHIDHVDGKAQDGEQFRRQHELDGKLVFMYSGNHSPSHPLTTILQAALSLRARDDLVFVFIGGGLGKKEVDTLVETHGLSNVLSLPYQPLAKIRDSLSAADAHIVSVGEDVIGCVHPCKVYGAMAVSRPILLLGPRRCHVAEILDGNEIGWRIEHGDVEGAIRTISRILETDRDVLRQMGGRAQRLVEQKYAKHLLCSSFGDVLERGLRELSVVPLERSGRYSARTLDRQLSTKEVAEL